MACTCLTSSAAAAKAARAGAYRRGLALGLFAVAALWTGAAFGQSFDRGLLWRLDRPGIPPSYVFGTLHSADLRVTTLPPAVAQAFAACRTYAMEIQLTEADEVHFFEATQFDDGQRLDLLLGAGDYAELRRLLGDSEPGDEILARTKPWAALLRVAALSSSDGPTLDRELFAAARRRHMGIVGLELLDEQIVALDSIPSQTQLALLKHAIEHRTLLEAQLDPTIQAWLDRDLGALARLNAAAMAGDQELEHHQALFTRRIVDDRSALMAYRLFMPLRSGGVFVAVGALHLHGANGMLAQLKHQGYRLHRVY